MIAQNITLSSKYIQEFREKITDIPARIEFQRLLLEFEQEIIKRFIERELCLNCGKEKEGSLSDFCSSCLENE